MTSRPTSATIIGWLFIGLSALMVLSSSMTMIMLTQFPDDFVGGSPDAPDAPWAWRVMFSMFNYFEFLIGLQFVLAMVGICGGIGLLRLKSWARILLEFLTWIGFLYTAGFGFLWLFAVGSMSFGSSVSQEARITGSVMFIMGCFMILAFLVPFVVVLVALRGKKIKTAIQETKDRVAGKSIHPSGFGNG